LKTIAPIRERGLPRVSAAEARAAGLGRRLDGLLARLPARGDVSLGSLGAVTLALVGRVPRDAVRPEAVSFGLGRPVIEGRLSIDARLGQRAVAAALGEGSDDGARLIGPLGFGERGLLAGLVARVLDALDAPLALSLDSRERLLGAETVAFALEVTAFGMRGWAQLEVPARWVEELGRLPSDPAALGALPVTACLEVGRTLLSAGDVADLDDGDAVVFDGQPAPGGSESDWGVSLVIGDAVAAASLSAQGRLQIESAFGGPRPSANRETNGSEEVIMSSEATGEATAETSGKMAGDETTRLDVTALLAAAPVEVVAEVGRIVLRGEEVLALGPGAVLMLGGPRTAEVTLRVGDELWAEGELVDVDGALAVRVTRALRPPPARR
jgi:flagellar motor switch/type III secretory pathway protein FliN